jgi:hypothetical protein
LLEIGKKEKQDISLNYDVSFKSYKHALLFKDTSVITKNDNSSLGKAFQVTDFKLKEKANQEEYGLSFNTKIKPSEMNPDIYLLTVDAIAKDLQEQQWWDEWSSTDANLTDGSKTYNLAQFLGQLKTLTTDVMNNGDAQAVVGRFCFAIEKK